MDIANEHNVHNLYLYKQFGWQSEARFFTCHFISRGAKKSLPVRFILERKILQRNWRANPESSSLYDPAWWSTLSTGRNQRNDRFRKVDLDGCLESRLSIHQLVLAKWTNCNQMDQLLTQAVYGHI